MAGYIIYPDRDHPGLGCLMNHTNHAFRLDGKYWRSVDHFLFAMRFENPPIADRIRKCKTAREAAALAGGHWADARPDWDGVKRGLMRRAVLAKFKAHPAALAVLLSTGRASLVPRPTAVVHLPDGRARSDGLPGVVLTEARGRLRTWVKRREARQEKRREAKQADGDGAEGDVGGIAPPAERPGPPAERPGPPAGTPRTALGQVGPVPGQTGPVPGQTTRPGQRPPNARH